MDDQEFVSWLLRSPSGTHNGWSELPSAPSVDVPGLIAESRTAVETVTPSECIQWTGCESRATKRGG
jgi:hypothetical protein